jgi:arsenite transporter
VAAPAPKGSLDGATLIELGRATHDARWPVTVWLERHQAWIYLASVLLGLGAGTSLPDAAGGLEVVVWPTLGALLYATFVQVRLTHLAEAARDVRFVGAVLVGNFVVLPLLVRALLPLAGDDLGVQVGVLLVLLVPCTDWFLTFTHLAGGDTRRAIAVTPLLLLTQMVLLPFYLWLFLGERFPELIAGGRLVAVFVTLIVLPFAAAWLTQRAVERTPRGGQRLTTRLAALPVPLLAVVVFLLAASQVGVVLDTTRLLPRLLVLYAAFLSGAAVIGLVIAWRSRLPRGPATAVIFSFGTRNSFVVLPFALALPAGFEIAVVAVVFQSLVELFGMIVYLRVVPALVRALPAASTRA